MVCNAGHDFRLHPSDFGFGGGCQAAAISFDLTSNKGILFGRNLHNSSLFIFDRFSLENYNSVIFAKSGSGKLSVKQTHSFKGLLCKETANDSNAINTKVP